MRSFVLHLLRLHSKPFWILNLIPPLCVAAFIHLSSLISIRFHFIWLFGLVECKRSSSIHLLLFKRKIFEALTHRRGQCGEEERTTTKYSNGISVVVNKCSNTHQACLEFVGIIILELYFVVFYLKINAVASESTAIFIFHDLTLEYSACIDWLRSLKCLIAHFSLSPFISDAEAQREFDEKQELNNIELNRYVIVWMRYKWQRIEGVEGNSSGNSDSNSLIGLICQ